MKNIVSSVLVLLVLTAKAQAQIPNYEFEQWWTVGNTQVPTDWFTYNLSSAGNYYPVSTDTSHYPVTVGTTSARLENNTALLPANEAKGIMVSSTQLQTLPSFQTPSFQLSGHPNSLTGYYKFVPQNGDSMWVAINLFQNGVIVSQGSFFSSAAAPNWTFFNIPLSTYTNADSAEISIAAYNASQPNNNPHGNSVLNIDNLNFDNLISGIAPFNEPQELSLFPNPTNGSFTINLGDMNPTDDAELEIINPLSQLVYQEKLTQSTSTTFTLPDLSGMYTVRVKTKDRIWIGRLVKIAD